MSAPGEWRHDPATWSDDGHPQGPPGSGTADEVHEVDRERAAARIRVALDDGVLTVQQAGQRLSEVYRARSRARLDRLTEDLDPPEPAADDRLDRATLLRAGLRVLFLAALAALLLTALLHGIGPIDRF
ncbi:DUF1707 domain-containing protein [Pseudonocardia sp. RS11V-5]|uniref:DUF1707 SHOCT-like domain-containing protein n=1 Tax=Pseudonocardia terrae TaxID=2905831 RepID=UPI001E5482E4|nr:DUF1707 domain-containing protein [Pseudonocardia terrae]MCE3554073.1 DUF1707 domain-containing protein [Pseudonocardia terrae]